MAARSFANTAPVDDRNRQSKALVHFEEQRAVWERVQKNLAKKVNRSDPAETLPGSIHHQRLRNEELGILDVAVPASVRNGSNAWEMSLRGGAGGVRYVQIGKAYPYPLYCPIRDSDCVDNESNALMRMIPLDRVPQRNKPASESEYFHDRQTQFRKFVQKKFSHFQGNEDPLVVEGCVPPLSDGPIPEDDGVEPVYFVPRSAPSNAHSVTQYVTEEPKSRPLSAITDLGGLPPASSQLAAASGPMLYFSTSHVSFTTAPGESAQGTVVVDNIGTTAVYYSWAVVPQVVLSEEKQPDYFQLSDPSSGVMLPEDQKMFTFTVRAPIPGVFTKQYELLTVPAGKERIIVHLRGVVISNEVNYVATTRLEAELHKKAMRDYQRHILAEPIWNPDNLVLDHANIDIELRNLTKAKAKKLAEIQGVGEFQEGSWSDLNAPLGIPYNQAVYSKIMSLHRNFHQFLSALAEKQSSGRAVTSQKEWDGSVKSLIEDITLLKDGAARNTFFNALNALLECARASEDRAEPLHLLLSRSAGRAAWSHAIEEMHRYTLIAKDMAEGKSIKAKAEKVEVGKGVKPPPKAAAKPAKGAAAPAPVDHKSSDAVDVKHPNYDKFFYAGVRRIVGDTVESIFGRCEAARELIAVATDRPFECAVKKRIDGIVAHQVAPDPEIDVLPDNSKQKKK